MITNYYLLAGHLLLASEAFSGSAELSQTLSKHGFDKSDMAKAEAHFERAEELLAQRSLQLEDRIADHNIHSAACEVEMWLQTVKFQLRPLDDDELLEQAVGGDVHAHNHTLTVVGQALRSLAMFRTHPKVQAAVDNERKIHDTCGRGWTLLKRLIKASDIRLKSTSPAEDQAIFEALADHQQEMRVWLDRLDSAAREVPDGRIVILGPLGYVPDGVGQPLGGAGYSVQLHANAQTTAPDPSQASPTSGWSVGRQGRNNENLGRGWIDPTFK